jgi:protein-S-isoprenylcysteine O-methyltransferase Ste14
MQAGLYLQICPVKYYQLMETAAYYIALLIVVLFPPGILFWFIIHPFARRWRKLGPVSTYSVVVLFLVSLGSLIYLVREPVLRVRFGVSAPLSAIALPLFLAGLYVGVKRMHLLTLAIMLGVPEVSKKSPGRLITEGIYGYVRHPRYLEIGLVLASIALFVNYLAIYLILAAYMPVIYFVILLEERELRERFGKEYERYCQKVPRFIPRARKPKAHT